MDVTAGISGNMGDIVGRLSDPTPIRLRIFQLQKLCTRVLCKFGVSAEICCETVKLGHWHGSDCWVWVEILGFQKCGDSANPHPKEMPEFSAPRLMY